MVSLATYPHIDPFRRSVFSPLVIDGLLRRDLHSDGLVVSDDRGVAVATCLGVPAMRARMFHRRWRRNRLADARAGDRHGVRHASFVTSDDALPLRVDDAALPILRPKEALELLSCGR